MPLGERPYEGHSKVAAFDNQHLADLRSKLQPLG